jgi:hypothetical protein
MKEICLELPSTQRGGSWSLDRSASQFLILSSFPQSTVDARNSGYQKYPHHCPVLTRSSFKI